MALHRLRTLVLALLILTPLTALAQTPPPPAAASSEQLLKPEELDALVAPIALYPDTLLSAGLDGVDLPAGGRAGRPLGEREQEPQGRSIKGCGGQAESGMTA